MKNIKKKIIFSFSILLILLIALSTTIFFLVFTNSPTNNNLPYDTKALQSGFAKLHSELNIIKSLPVERKNVEREITLNANEFNALAAMGIFANSSYQNNNPFELSSLSIKNDNLQIRANYQLNNKILGKKFITINCGLTPLIKNDDIHLTFTKLKFGHLPLPASFINTTINKDDNFIQANRDLKLILECITELKISNNQLYIKYIPYKMLNILKQLNINNI